VEDSARFRDDQDARRRAREDYILIVITKRIQREHAGLAHDVAATPRAPSRAPS